MVNFNQRTTAFAILIGFALASIVLWWISDGISEWSRTANPLLVAFAYIILTPVYLGILIALTYYRKIRGLLAGFFLILAVEIADLPHLVTKGGMLPSETMGYFFPDTMLAKLLGSWGLNGDLLAIAVYIVVPLVFLLIAYEILVPRTFIRSFKQATFGEHGHLVK